MTEAESEHCSAADSATMGHRQSSNHRHRMEIHHLPSSNCFELQFIVETSIRLHPVNIRSQVWQRFSAQGVVRHRAAGPCLAEDQGAVILSACPSQTPDKGFKVVLSRIRGLAQEIMVYSESQVRRRLEVLTSNSYSAWLLCRLCAERGHRS